MYLELFQFLSYKNWYSWLQINIDGFSCSILFKMGLYSWKHTSVKCETFVSYFLWHSEYLHKIFYFVIATLIDNLKGLLWKGTVQHNNYSWTNSKNLLGMPLISFIFRTGKHVCQSLFLNKVAGLSPPTLLKTWIWQRCFPVNFAKFLRTSNLKNFCERPRLDAGWRTM